MSQTKQQPKTTWTCAQLAEALKNFKPRVPISFIVAARRAARNR